MREKWKKKRSRRLRRKRRKMRARSSAFIAAPFSSTLTMLLRVTTIELLSARLELSSFPRGREVALRLLHIYLFLSIVTAALIRRFAASFVQQQHTSLSSRVGVVNWSKFLYHVQQYCDVSVVVLVMCENSV
ncbi:hypothetical protein BJV78DRAFT_1207136 [Lactifluus subvellereus]|nr:hypothetical protein BJV78DRAFT_1207136 [Lactifluus subvellereus]